MTLAAQLANASRVLNAVNDKLPVDHKLDTEAEWAALEAAVNDTRSAAAAALAPAAALALPAVLAVVGRARRIGEIVEWERELRARVSARLLHAPLEQVTR